MKTIFSHRRLNERFNRMATATTNRRIHWVRHKTCAERRIFQKKTENSSTKRMMSVVIYCLRGRRLPSLSYRLPHREPNRIECISNAQHHSLLFHAFFRAMLALRERSKSLERNNRSQHMYTNTQTKRRFLFGVSSPISHTRTMTTNALRDDTEKAENRKRKNRETTVDDKHTIAWVAHTFNRFHNLSAAISLLVTVRSDPLVGRIAFTGPQIKIQFSVCDFFYQTIIRLSCNFNLLRDFLLFLVVWKKDEINFLWKIENNRFVGLPNYVNRRENNIFATRKQLKWTWMRRSKKRRKKQQQQRKLSHK